jgi:hypothetical protein
MMQKKKKAGVRSEKEAYRKEISILREWYISNWSTVSFKLCHISLEQIIKEKWNFGIYLENK